MDHTLWVHLPLLIRSNSKDSVEFILQTLWRTRKTGLHSTDRDLIREMLQLPNDSDLDPLLVCLRILIRRSVYENISKDEIQKLFPAEVPPELQRLLTLLLQKFQREWRDDAHKDQVSLPRLKAMTWDMAKPGEEPTDRVAVINLKLQDDTQTVSGEKEVKFQLAKDTMDTMLKSMYYIRDQLSNNLIYQTTTADLVDHVLAKSFGMLFFSEMRQLLLVGYKAQFDRVICLLSAPCRMHGCCISPFCIYLLYVENRDDLARAETFTMVEMLKVFIA